MAAAAVTAATFMLAAGPAAAQATKVEKNFDGWLVVCVENGGNKRCSMSQSRMVAKTKQVVFAWTIVAGRDKKLTSVLTTPTGVSVQDGIRLSFGNNEPLQVNYSVCGPRACQASMPFDAEAVKRMQGVQKVAVNFVGANKRLVQTEVDLKGFSNAYSYLTDQMK